MCVFDELSVYLIFFLCLSEVERGTLRSWLKKRGERDK